MISSSSSLSFAASTRVDDDIMPVDDKVDINKNSTTHITEPSTANKTRTPQFQKLLASQNSSQTDNSSTNNSNGWLTYYNYSYGISLQYPSNWQLDRKPFSIITLSSNHVDIIGLNLPITLNSPSYSARGPGDRDAWIIIGIEPVMQVLDPITLDVRSKTVYDYAQKKYNDVTTNNYPNIATFQLLQSLPISLDGLPAYRIVYDWTPVRVTHLLPQYTADHFVIRGNSLYTIEFVVVLPKANEVVPVAQQIIDSLRFVSTSQQQNFSSSPS
jgi:hypothetical protein